MAGRQFMELFFTESFGQVFIEFFQIFKSMTMFKFAGSAIACSRAVFTADKRSFIIDPAKVVFCQEPAFTIDFEKPLSLFDEDSNALVREKPSYILEFFFSFRRIQLKSKISAAF
jgi:hypothetical protein